MISRAIYRRPPAPAVYLFAGDSAICISMAPNLLPRPASLQRPGEPATSLSQNFRIEIGHPNWYSERVYIFNETWHRKYVGGVSDPEAALGNHYGLSW
jgi:hypothetical protein